MIAGRFLEDSDLVYRDLLRSLRALCCGSPEPRLLGSVLQRYAESLAALIPERNVTTGTYRRTALYRSSDFELLLLEWGPESTSAIHDHAGQHCSVVVLDGALGMDDYLLDPKSVRGQTARIDFVRERDGLGPGTTDYRRDDIDLHRVYSPRGATSLHVYAHPIERCHSYDPVAKTRRMIKMEYDAVGVPWLTGTAAVS